MDTYVVTGGFVLVTPNREMRAHLSNQGVYPVRVHDVNALLQSYNGLPQSSDATVVDWASWAGQAKGNTSLLSKGVTRTLRHAMANGAPAVLLIRLCSPRVGWRRALRGGMPRISHHCLCGYVQMPNTPHLQVRALTSGLLVH